MLLLRAPLVLASQSPRRRALLDRLGVEFDVHPSHVDETFPPGAGPADAVEALALRKARAVAPEYADALTLGADTIVVLDGGVLEKPADSIEAFAMLRRLSGQTHTVYSGLALIHPPSGRTATDHEATAVTFAELGDDEIAAYVRTGSPLDKAGAYGIQDDLGALFVARIEGDYYNVVGLPLHRMYQLLRAHFADLLDIKGVAPDLH